MLGCVPCSSTILGCMLDTSVYYAQLCALSPFTVCLKPLLCLAVRLTVLEMLRLHACVAKIVMW